MVGLRTYSPSPGFVEAAAAPPASEVSGKTFSWSTWYAMRTGPCRTFVNASFCGIESDMWTMVRALVEPSDTVLELGARYGTTSCVLAEATNNSGRVVSVEPDPQAHRALWENRLRHRCNFGIWHGAVATRPQVLAATYNGGEARKVYEVRTREARPDDTPTASLAHIDTSSLERLTGLAFNVLVVDCEGCLADVLSVPLLRRAEPRLELILLEQDVHKRINYAEWHLRLLEHGFRRIWNLEDSIFEFRAPKHVAYERGTARRTPSCLEYAHRQRGWPRCVPFKRGHRCGSRVTCLPTQVVNRSFEAAWVKKTAAKMAARATGRGTHAQW